MNNTRIGALDISSGGEGTAYTVTLTGQADMRDGSELTKALLDVHQLAVTASSKTVAVDVTKVEFMNSTALGAFVGWVAELQKVTADKRYRITFRGSNSHRWQRGSLHALASFAPDHISVEFN